MMMIIFLFFYGSVKGVAYPGSPHFTHSVRPSWLIATMSPAYNLQRRMIIRQTWQKLYADSGSWTTRFVISRAANQAWQSIIEAENQIFGDIIQLSHLEETGKVANTVKSVEFFKYLAASGQDRELSSANKQNLSSVTTSLSQPFSKDQLQKWKFVSKLDDDSFLDARNFWNHYLVPLQERNRTIVGRTLRNPNFTYAGGQFYTLTWDMVSLVADLHAQNPISDEAEDVLNGRLLYEAGEPWTHVDLPSPIAFDYEDKQLLEEGKAFASADANLEDWAHAVGPQAINPHKMKDDDTYLKVAACFDEHGVIKPPTNP